MQTFRKVQNIFLLNLSLRASDGRGLHEGANPGNRGLAGKMSLIGLSLTCGGGFACKKCFMKICVIKIFEVALHRYHTAADTG